MLKCSEVNKYFSKPLLEADQRWKFMSMSDEERVAYKKYMLDFGKTKAEIEMLEDDVKQGKEKIKQITQEKEKAEAQVAQEKEKVKQIAQEKEKAEAQIAQEEEKERL